MRRAGFGVQFARAVPVTVGQTLCCCGRTLYGQPVLCPIHGTVGQFSHGVRVPTEQSESLGVRDLGLRTQGATGVESDVRPMTSGQTSQRGNAVDPDAGRRLRPPSSQPSVPSWHGDAVDPDAARRFRPPSSQPTREAEQANTSPPGQGAIVTMPDRPGRTATGKTATFIPPDTPALEGELEQKESWPVWAKWLAGISAAGVLAGGAYYVLSGTPKRGTP